MKSLIYWFIGILLLVIGGTVLWYTFFSPNSLAPSNTNTQGGNPFGNPAGTASTTGTPVVDGFGNPGSTLTIMSRDRKSFQVPDFTKQNQPPTANAQDGYNIAGSGASAFHILYFPLDSSILVSLYAEPLGDTRLAAESALRTALGLSNSQLCSLLVSVRTSSDVNPYYAGKELGLSFCPGATVLPQ